MRWLLAAFGAILLGAPAMADEKAPDVPEVPELTVTLSPTDAGESGVWLGQELVMTVRVASRYPYEALDLRLPEIKGAELRTMVKPNTRLLKSYAGEHTVLETVLSIYPDRSGSLVIPPVRVSGVVEPEPNQNLTFEDKSSGYSIDVAGIAKDYAADWWMVSRQVSVDEKWSIPVDELRVGDVVRREITVTATGVPDERMPVLEHRRTRGVSVADAGGERFTERTADGVIGTVRHAWDLKIERGGFVYVSPIGVTHWDPASRTARKTSVRGYRIEPLPADAEAIAARLMAEARAEHAGVRQVFTFVVVIVALPLFGLAGACLWVVTPSRADLALWRACHERAAPHVVYLAIMDWSHATGIDNSVRLAPVEFGAVTRALFADGTDPTSPDRLSATLLRRGRAERSKCLKDRLSWLRDELLGPHRGLRGQARSAENPPTSQRERAGIHHI